MDTLQELIKNFEPLNKKDVIEGLVNDVVSKGLNTEESYFKIKDNIRAAKLQIFFKENFKDKFDKKTLEKPQKSQYSPAPRPYVKPRQDIIVGEALGDMKYIFGTYFEMGFHNFFLTMNHILGKVCKEDITKVSDLQTVNYRGDVQNFDYAREDVWDLMFQKLSKLTTEEQAKAEELFEKHFPVLVPMKEFAKTSKKEAYHGSNSLDILKILYTAIKTYRNIFSHYKFELGTRQAIEYAKVEEFLLHSLGLCFEGAKRIIKDRFGYDENNMLCATRFTVQNDYEHKDAKGRPGKKKVERKEFIYQLYRKNIEDNRQITIFGLVMLASLFLEKKYSKIMADKLHCIKKSDAGVICEMIAVYRIRLHIQKLTAVKDTDALALDILTELRKCPQDLFDILSPEDQKKFRISSKLDESEEGDVLMVRKSDRFPHLLMKYIDDSNAFESIRFQVSLGKYFYRFYNKQCIDGLPEPRVRTISKDVHGFGRITEVENARKLWGDGLIREFDDIHKNTVDERPYITDHYASYVFNNNKIGLRIFDEEEGKVFIPELKSDGVRNVAPTCWMSIYEMPAIALLMQLKGAGAVEARIKDVVANFKKLLNDVKDGVLRPVMSADEFQEVLNNNYGGICADDVPEKVKDYLFGRDVNVKEEFQRWAEWFISDALEGTEYKLKRINEDLQVVKNPKMNKIGKKNYVRIKPGNLAKFLAKDIMFFQQNDADNRNKLTSLNFNILQSALAVFDGGFDNLRRMFEAAHLIAHSADGLGNPVITKMCNSGRTPRNTVEFYKQYLYARKDFLKQCLEQKNYESLYFLYADRKKWEERSEEYYKDLAGRYLKESYGGTEYDKPLELPRGLFDAQIREALSKYPALKDIANDKTKNTSYLIYAYFMKVLNDDCQQFYYSKRSYQIFNSLYRKKPRDPKTYFSPNEIYSLLNRSNPKSFDAEIKRFVGGIMYTNRGERMTLAEKRESENARLRGQLSKMKNTETDLKRYKIEDMMLFLIAKEVLKGKDEGDKQNIRQQAIEKLKLKDLVDGDFLSQKIPFQVVVESHKGHKKIVKQDDLKLINYSQFYRFLNDRRIPTLFDIVLDRVISREEIEKELSTYDDVHPNVLKGVLDYEKAYVDQNGNLYITEGEYQRLADFKEILSKDDSIPEDERRKLSYIRNTFAHSSYASTDASKRTAIPKKADALSAEFTNTLKKIDNNPKQQ